MYVFRTWPAPIRCPVPGYITVFPLFQRVQYARCPASAWRTTDGLDLALGAQGPRIAC